jgi:hypothetical protein
MLHHNCAKGLDLLVEGPPPPVMGAIPDVDPRILGLLREAPGGQRTWIEPGARVTLGAPLTLTHNETSGHGYQVVFVVSSGLLDGGEACGDGSAQLACSTCGEEGFLKRITWTPTTPGPATLAVGAARMIVGTPAVKLGRMLVDVIVGDEVELDLEAASASSGECADTVHRTT